MTDDLEGALRTILAERAGDIVSVPAGLLTPDVPDTLGKPGASAGLDGDADVLEFGLRRADLLRAARRRWPLLLAAAAVAALLGGVLTLVHPGSSAHHVPPAPDHRHHTAASAPTVQRRSCVVTDPTQWNADVVSHTFVPTGVDAAQSVGIQAVLPNGDAVIQYDLATDPANTIGTDLGVLAPGSRSPRDLGYFGVPSHGSGSSFSIDVEADPSSRTVAVSVEGGAHNRGPSVKTIYALDVDTGHRTLLTSQSRYPHGQLQVGYVQDGTVYYEVDPSVSTATDIYGVPISGGTSRRVGGEGGVALQQSALGLMWSENGPIDGPADVPAVVARHGAADLSDTFDSYVTDGTSYAWATRTGALQWYSTAGGHIVSFPHLLGGSSRLSLNAVITAVAGPLVSYQGKDGDAQWILDTRSGARVHITSGGTILGAAGGVAVGNPLLAGGRESGSAQLLRMSTSGLTPLRC